MATCPESEQLEFHINIHGPVPEITKSMSSNLSQIESRLWSAADQLWANTGLKPSEFSNPVLGLIFLRYAEKRFQEAEPVLTDKERDEVKKVAKELLAKLKAEKLVLDWKLKTQTKADVERTIRDFFIRLPKAYSSDLKKSKRAKTYAHVYESYFGAGQSVYQGMSAGVH